MKLTFSSQTLGELRILSCSFLENRGVDAVREPATVIRTANEYALTGFRLLSEELRGQSDLQVHLFSLVE